MWTDHHIRLLWCLLCPRCTFRGGIVSCSQPGPTKAINNLVITCILSPSSCFTHTSSYLTSPIQSHLAFRSVHEWKWPEANLCTQVDDIIIWFEPIGGVFVSAWCICVGQWLRSCSRDIHLCLMWFRKVFDRDTACPPEGTEKTRGEFWGYF